MRLQFVDRHILLGERDDRMLILIALDCALPVHSLLADVDDSKHAFEAEEVVAMAIQKVLPDPLVLDYH